MSEVIASVPLADIQSPDYDGLKIETFEGINDQPIAPTADNGSNISHVHAKHNELIDSIVTGNNELKKAIKYNYDYGEYLYTQIYSNKTNIETNTTTITNQTAAINTVNTQIYSLDIKIERLAKIIFRNQNNFIYDNVNPSENIGIGFIDRIYTPKAGNISIIYFEDLSITGLVDLYIDGETIYGNVTDSNYTGYTKEYDLSNLPSNVNIGSEIQILTPNSGLIGNVEIVIE